MSKSGLINLNIVIIVVHAKDVYKRQAYKLRKVEVAYELKIRGLSADGSANDLRKRWTQAKMCIRDSLTQASFL